MKLETVASIAIISMTFLIISNSISHNLKVKELNQEISALKIKCGKK